MNNKEPQFTQSSYTEYVLENEPKGFQVKYIYYCLNPNKVKVYKSIGRYLFITNVALII